MGEIPATIPGVNGSGTKEDGEVKDEPMDTDKPVDGEDGEDGEVSNKKKKPKKKGDKRKLKKPDKIAEMGVVGQEARKMRIEARRQRQEEYKKNAEKNCK